MWASGIEQGVGPSRPQAFMVQEKAVVKHQRFGFGR